ncbi:MAG: hypothetical protein RLZZ361_1406 [Cyanobacteriota bacterium]|jgi:hypothetical protein
MKLQEIFAKNIDRPIDGVIKADDASSVALEVEEYVLTKELKKHLDLFLHAYNNSKVSNGVWISGLFGSGKSHLLKMLATVLGHKELDGKDLLGIFKAKCDEDIVLVADLEKACKIPSQSILFNIDQKSDIINKKEVDALLAVFVKVFDEACGYYGKQGYIAQFERDLDEEGLLTQFKSEFEKTAGNSWDEWGRSRTKRLATEIDLAYNTVTSRKESNILDKYRDDYSLSIEDFAEHVNHYIDKQEKGFRLNFFVDEVGQYIADNVKLMTNLQTVAESLITKTKGRAWIIVTAQEDMNTVVGEMDKNQSNDFSKIQARFSIPLRLTSSDVAEVVQKRLLAKKPEVLPKLQEIYDKHINNFKTLFDFSDNSAEYRNYQDFEHFSFCYPFVPYQFRLFQTSIQNLSDHNAFDGKHRSVGERSLITVFQEVAKNLKDQELGDIATFDLMYDGIKRALKTNLTRAINRAEAELDNPFAIKVLKALCLVKYIKEFKATIRNICILMQSNFDEDVTKLKKKVEEALSRLEQQTYIQRNGDEYEYLTDEEKDVEEEIKKTEVENSSIQEELQSIIYRIIKNKKIRYSNVHDYSFATKLDDKLYGRDYELSINIASPFNENIDNETVLKAHNMGKNELLIVMAADKRLVDDLLTYKRTDKYISQNGSSTQQDSIKRILSDKAHQNRTRHNNIEIRVKELLSEAKLFINGNLQDIGGEDPQNRIEKAFVNLIEATYTNLGMIYGEAYKEQDIVHYLSNSQSTLNGSLQESEQELFNHIKAQQSKGIRVSVKDLLDRFQIKPYGWYPSAILCSLAKLFASSKVEISQDSNILEAEDLAKKLTNAQFQSQLIIKPQQEFSQAKIRQLKDFHKDFFDEPLEATEPKLLARDIEIKLKDLKTSLKAYLAEINHIPCVASLKQPLDLIETCLGKPYTWYLEDFLSKIDELLDSKESVIDPIDKFMNGPQKDIYENARDFIKANEANFSILDRETLTNAKNILEDLTCYKSNKIQELKVLIERLEEELNTRLSEERAKLISQLQTKKEALENLEEFNSLPAIKVKEFKSVFNNFIEDIEAQKLFDVLHGMMRTFEENQYRYLLTELTSSERSNKTGSNSTEQSSSNTALATKSEAQATSKVIMNRNLKVDFKKPLLSSAEDVESYTEAVKESMLKEIKQGNRIQL